MCMHVAIGLITYNALVRIAPVRRLDADKTQSTARARWPEGPLRQVSSTRRTGSGERDAHPAVVICRRLQRHVLFATS